MIHQNRKHLAARRIIKCFLAAIAVFIGSLLIAGKGDGKSDRKAKVWESAVRLQRTSAYCFDNEAVFAQVERDTNFKDFIAILESENPYPIYREILREGSLAGKIYALCGIYFCSKDAFEREVQLLQKSMPVGKVHVIDGDQKFDLLFSDLMDGKEMGAVRLYYSESLSEYGARTGKLGVLDVIGGGIPVRLLDETWIEHRNRTDFQDARKITEDQAQEFLEAKRKFYSRWLDAMRKTKTAGGSKK